jgi:hypothetical protein
MALTTRPAQILFLETLASAIDRFLLVLRP